MSNAGHEDERRGFSSRTPDNNNPDRVRYRRGFVTKHQVTGWRFVMRRLSAGVAMHDARMLVDPLRSQSRALTTGVLAVVAAVIGCFIFSLIRPGGDAGTDVVLADRASSALYVRVNDQLHPVLNLASARLIAGKPVSPKAVNARQLDKFGRGPLIGIPGAPERMVANTATDADWTVCEGIPAAGAAAGVSLIAGPPATDGERARALPGDRAVLVDGPGGSWLLWNGRRSAIDVNDRAVTGALGWGNQPAQSRPISSALFNAVPEGPALRAPAIAGAGTPAGYPVGAPVGSVVAAYGSGDALDYYAVLNDGLQPISGVLAAILRNTDSHGLTQPPRLSADQIATLPVSHQLDTAAYPDRELRVVEPAQAPITCLQWVKPEGAATSSAGLLSGAVLPVTDVNRTVRLVNAPAARAAITPGYGYLVQTVGNDAAAPAAGSLFWVSDTGVRYGIEGGTGRNDGPAKTAAALGLDGPALPMPWSILSLLSAGPALSQADALTAADFTAPAPNPTENR
ncbi:MAG: type VII secretion protein EccB [Mycolicibacterium insubricum]